MTKNDIITELAKKKEVEKIVHKYYKKREQLDDLVQMIYLALLEKDEEQIVSLYENGELNKYIAGMVHRQIVSNKSEWYLQHRRDIKEGFPIDMFPETFEIMMGAEEEEEENEMLDGLKNIIDKLPQKDKDILYRLSIEYFNDEYMKDIMSEYGMSYRQVVLRKQHLFNMISQKLKGENKYEFLSKEKKNIYMYNEKMELIKIYKNRMDIVEEWGIDKNSISMCLCHRIKMTKTNKGEKVTFRYDKYSDN